jgi:hypothetical protein
VVVVAVSKQKKGRCMKNFITVYAPPTDTDTRLEHYAEERNMCPWRIFVVTEGYSHSTEILELIAELPDKLFVVVTGERSDEMVWGAFLSHEIAEEHRLYYGEDPKSRVLEVHRVKL